MDDNGAIRGELLLWQLADAAFPSGGLANSGGLEAAVRWGHVRDSADLVRLLSDQLTQTARSMIPPLHRACRATAIRRDRPAVPGDAEQSCGQSRQPGSRKITRNGGRGGIRQTGHHRACPADRQRSAAYASGPTFGAIVAALEVPADVAGRLFLYIALRSSISSPVRLNVVGPLEAQAIQYRLASLVASLSRHRPNSNWSMPPRRRQSWICSKRPRIGYIHGCFRVEPAEDSP